MGNKARSRSPYWGSLEAKAHLPEVQALIRRAIFSGRIRVVPASDGGIRIIPTVGSAVEEPQFAAHEGHEQAQTTRVETLKGVGRVTS
jgi:hypothetical protein